MTPHPLEHRPTRSGSRAAHKGQQTRASILDAALNLASQKGLEGLSIGLLAETTVTLPVQVNGKRRGEIAVPAGLAGAALEAEEIHLSEATLDYLLALVHQSRIDEALPQPLSPRAARTLLAVSRAWALVAGRRFVTTEDVQAVFPYVAEHRLRGSFGVQRGEACPLSQRLLARVDPDHP